MLTLLLLSCSAFAAFAAGCGVPANPPNEVSSFIVGGVDAEPHTWPWMAEVIKNGGHYCGGTLINNEWIVSAAHCFEKNPKLGNYEFSVGGHLSADLSEVSRQTSPASIIIRHENYGARSSSNDIALIKLANPVVFNDNVSPACLAEERPFDGTVAYITGWGDQETVIRDKDLQQTNVPIVNQDVCQAAYSQYDVDKSMVCAGYPEGGRDSCQGDSGGPMVVKDNAGIWSLVGITSWGIGCADAGYYGVYSDVAYLNSWVQSTMAAN